jgi:hypothetical protein
MKRYNPFVSALSAAYSELTSDQAKHFYAQRATDDFQATIGVITALGAIAFYLGQQCRQWMDKQPDTECAALALNDATTSALFLTNIEPVTILSIETVQPRTLPSFQPIALLSAAPNNAPRRVFITSAVLPSSDSVLVTPVAEALSLVEARAASSVERLNMGIRELRALARERGVKGYGKMSKTVLMSLLAV